MADGVQGGEAVGRGQTGKPRFRLARRDQRSRVLHHLREAQRGIARGCGRQTPVSNAVDGRKRGTGVFSQATGARLGDQREKFACASQLLRSFLRRAGNEGIAHETGIASAKEFPHAFFLALVALDVGERRQADDGRVWRVGHRDAQRWRKDRHGQRPSAGCSFCRICSSDWRRRISENLPSRRRRTSGASGKEL